MFPSASKFLIFWLRRIYCGHSPLRGSTSIGYCICLIVFSFQSISLSSKQSSVPSPVFAWRTSLTTPFSSSWKWLQKNPSPGKMHSSRVPSGSFAFLTGRGNEYSQPSIARHVDRFGLQRSWHGSSLTHCTRSTGPEGVSSEGSIDKIVYSRSACCIVISRPLSLASTLSRAPAVLVSHTIPGIWSSVPLCIWVASYFILFHGGASRG